MEKLNDRQKQLIDYLKRYQKLTTNEYQNMINKSLVTVKRDLLNLKEKKIIEYIGSSRRGYYRLVSK